jgi:predicted transcriptional regulator
MNINKRTNYPTTNQNIEHEILKLINKKEKCLYGDIIKEMKLSYTTGQKVIYSLLHKGKIEFIHSEIKLTESTKK